MSFSRAGIWVIALWMLGKLLAFGKDLLVSYYFGASAQTDAYFIASNIPALVYAGLLATVPLVLLPLYAKKKAAEGGEIANIFASSVLNWYAVLTAVLAFIVLVEADVLVSLLAPTASVAVTDLAIVLTRIFSATFVFSMVSAVFTTLQLSNKQVVGVQLIPVFNNAVFVLGVFLFSERYGIFAAAVSATLAWVLQIPLQTLFVRKVYRYSFVWRLSPVDRKAFLLVFFPAFISVSIEQLNSLVSIYFASGLGEGTVSILSYVFRMISLCTGAFIVVISTITYPEFAHKLSGNRVSEFLDDVYWSTKITLFFSVLLTIVVVLFNKEIITLVFERGNFSADKSIITASILAISAFSIPFVALREIYSRGIYAFGAARLAMLTGLIALVVNVLVSYGYVMAYGARALAVATVVSAAASCLIGFAVLHWVLRRRPDKYLYLFLVKLMAATTATVAVLLVLAGMFPLHNLVLRLATGSVAAALLFMIFSMLVGIVRFDFATKRFSGDLQRRDARGDVIG